MVYAACSFFIVCLQPKLLLCERARTTAKWGKYDYPHPPPCILGRLIHLGLYFAFFFDNCDKNSKVVKRLEIVIHCRFYQKNLC